MYAPMSSGRLALVHASMPPAIPRAEANRDRQARSASGSSGCPTTTVGTEKEDPGTSGLRRLGRIAARQRDGAGDVRLLVTLGEVGPDVDDLPAGLGPGQRPVDLLGLDGDLPLELDAAVPLDDEHRGEHRHDRGRREDLHPGAHGRAPGPEEPADASRASSAAFPLRSAAHPAASATMVSRTRMRTWVFMGP